MLNRYEKNGIVKRKRIKEFLQLISLLRKYSLAL